MLTWIAGNTVVSLALAGVALVLCRLLRARPAVCHLLWVLVLVRLVAPPLPLPQLGPEKLIRDRVAELTGQIESWIPGPVPPKAGMMEGDASPSEELPAGHTSNARVAPANGWEGAPARAPVAAGPASDGEREATKSGPAFVAKRKKKRERSDTGTAASTPVVPWTPAPSTAATWFTPNRLRLLLIAVWIAGTLVVLLRHMRRTLVVNRLVAGSKQAPERLQRLVASVAGTMELGAPEVRVMRGLKSPFVWAFGRTVLVWPDAAEPRFSRGVLAHELAHIKRRDHWTAWLDIAATSLLWWNPLVWYLRGRARFYAELSCDAWAVSLYPGDRRAYAETLIDVAESVSCGLALGHAEAKPQNFERRLRMVMREKMSCRIQPILAACAIAAVVCLYPTTSAAQDATEVASDTDPVIRDAVRARIVARRANWFYEAQDYENAVRSYRKLVEIEPENGKAWHRLGYCLLPIGKYEEAAAAFDKQLVSGFAPDNACYNLGCAAALRGRTDEALAWLERAIRSGFTQTRHMEDDKDLTGVREHDRFHELLELATEIDDLRDAAKEHFESYDWKEAAAAYQKVVDRMPKNGEALHRLGYALITSGQHAASEKVFLKQLETDFRRPTALYNLACATALQGKKQAAMEWLGKSVAAGFAEHKLLRTDSDLASLRDEPEFEVLRGRVLELAKMKGSAKVAHDVADWETAVVLYEKILGRKRDSGETWAQLADVHFQLGAFEDAKDARRKQINLGHDPKEGLFGLACAYAAGGDDAATFACLSDAVEIGYRDEDKLTTAAPLERLRGDRRFKAIRDRIADAKVLDSFGAVDWRHLQQRAEAKLAKKPNHGPSYLRLGWAHLRQGAYGEAVEAFKRQNEIGYMKSIARYNVACSYAKQGKKDAAFDWLDKAIDAGFVRPQHIATDPDLDSLRTDGRFEDFVARVKTAHWEKKGKRGKRKAKEKSK